MSLTSNLPYKQEVAGSSPAPPTKNLPKKQNAFQCRGEVGVIFCPCVDGSFREVLVDAVNLPEIIAFAHWRVYDKSQTDRTPLFHCLATVHGKTVFLHKFIAKPSPGLVVDHWNHDGLDNRGENLRCVTHAQNLLNQTTHPGRGITRRGNRFVSRVKINQKLIHLGTFGTREEAGVCVTEFLRSKGANA